MNEEELKKNKLKETIKKFNEKRKFQKNTGYIDNIRDRWTDEEILIIYNYGYKNGKRKGGKTK